MISPNGFWIINNMKLVKIILLSTTISLVGCKSEPKTFTITWKNEDQILEIDENVPLGTIPVYDGPTPTKINPIPVIKEYSFIGWDKELAPISSDMTYQAMFNESEMAALAITFNANEEHREFTFNNSNTKVDWGDDSEVSEEATHEYLENGDYVIRFYTDSVAQFDVASGRAGVNSLYFANTVNKISENGFKDLENLESVRLPGGLTNLSAYTFSNDATVNFYKEINHVYYLGNESNDHLYCFGTTNEEEINIAEGCEVLTNSSFALSDMTISLTLPSSLKIIGDDALKNCESIKSIVIPENVISIGNNAFKNCYELASVNIPNKIEVINESVFEKCRVLETIVIPNSVKEIKDASFYECTNLTLVDMSNVDHFITGGVDMFTGCANLTIKVKEELLAQYKNDPNWKNYNFIINQ